MNDTSTNLSNIKRKRLLDICSRIKSGDSVDIMEVTELEQFVKTIKYGLIFEEHKEPVDVKLRTHIPIFKEFKEVKNNPYGSDCNFLLEGDNLHSLKLLERTHKGRIDVISIDPPYNTGREFIYGDNIVGSEDGYKHSKWLSFMKERLLIAQKLLTSYGVAFIHIDNNELAPLKLLCDSIFGEDNVEIVVWHKEFEQSSGKMKRTKHFRDVHEYLIVCYKNKNIQFSKINQAMTVQKLQTTNLAKNNSNKTGDVTRIFKIKNPENLQEWEDEWKYSKEEIQNLIDNGLLYFGKKGINKPRQILPTDDRRQVYVESIITQGSSTAGRKDLENVLGKNKFDNPKPVKLIKTLIEISSNENALVCDFFAGSGTTGQAVLELNDDKSKHSNRKFILCTNNENNICQSVTFPRLRTVITGTRPDGSYYSEGMDANLCYLQTDFIDKDDDNLDELLYEASILLTSIENMTAINEKSICIIDNDDMIDEVILNSCDKIKVIYLADDVLLNSRQTEFFNSRSIEVKRIPQYYYKEV